MVNIWKTRSTVLLGASILAAASLALAACSGGGTSASQAPADLDEVHVDLTTAVTSIDPAMGPYLSDSVIVGLTSGRLVQFVQGSATETVPVLAESVTASSDATSYTVVLKPDLTFSDGSPLTSEDVVASLTRLRDTPGPNQSYAEMIVELAAPDITTVTIGLSMPFADFDQMLAVPAMGILPAAAATDEDYFQGEPVFSGPYVPEGNVKGSSFSLVRNETFAGTPPAIDKLDFSVVADAPTSVKRLESGDVDFVPALPQEVSAQLSGDVTAQKVDGLASLFIVPNNRPGGLFEDVRIRQAIAWAIDREALATSAFGPDVALQRGPYPVVADYPEPVEVYPKQDLAQAEKLLKGTACENGCTFTASFFASASDEAGRVAAVLQQQLEPLGMKINIQPVEDQQFIQNSVEGAFDLNVVTFSKFNVPSSAKGNFDPAATMCVFAGCENEQIAPAFDALFGAQTPQDQEAASAQVLQVFEKWTPIIPVAGVTGSYGVRSNLVDVIGLQPNSELWIAGQ